MTCFSEFFFQAAALEGQEASVVTEYIMKVSFLKFLINELVHEHGSFQQKCLNYINLFM